MNKITSQEALMSAFNAAKGKIALRSSDIHDINSVKKDILCCGGTGCHASNAQELMDNLKKYPLLSTFQILICRDDSLR